MQSFIEYRRLWKEAEIEHREAGDSGLLPSSQESEVQEEKSQDESHETDLDENDGHRPRNWPLSLKLLNTWLLFNLVFVTGWASAADSSTLQRARVRFHVGQVPETLSTALFLFGTGTGALFAGPISQVTGRNPTYFVSGTLYLLALLGSALSPNYATRIIMRMFAGFFASPSMTNYGGSLSDMYEAEERSNVWPVFALAPTISTLIAPISSGWLENSSLSWRWIDWVILIISGSAFLPAILLLPETYLKTITSWKVHGIQKATKDNKWHAKDEDSSSLMEQLKSHASKMLIFLTQEPITILFGIYLTLLYILIFTFLHGFTYIFGMTYGWNSGQVGSAFGAVCVGVLLGVPYVQAVNYYYKHRHLQGAQDATPLPESRLILTIPIAPLLPISLFWLAFTNRPDISPFSSLGACALFGFTLYTIFTSCYHYMIDAYQSNSSSAMAAVTFMRYYASGGMVIAAIPMYETLGVKWTMVLMGCVAAVLTPAPFLFWWKGESIRARSRFASKGDMQPAEEEKSSRTTSEQTNE